NPKPKRIWLVIDLEGTGKELAEWAKPLVGEDTYHIFAPRGIGPTEWSHKSPPNFVERSLALLGRTADEGRVWDIAAVVPFVKEEQGLTVLGRGQGGVLGVY